MKDPKMVAVPARDHRTLEREALRIGLVSARGYPLPGMVARMLVQKLREEHQKLGIDEVEEQVER